MTESCPCLVRIGENVKKYRIFKLERDQVTIGRSGDVTYSILSNMISRCHTTIKRQADGTWTIIDNKSLNGVYVNKQALDPNIPHALKEGDLVQLGVSTAPEKPAEFVYKFYSSLKIRMEKKRNKRMKYDPSLDKDTLNAGESSDEDREKKRKAACERLQDGARDLPNNDLRKIIEESQQLQAEKEKEYLSRLAEMERLLKEKEEMQQKVQEQLERERQEKEHQAQEVKELKLKEQAIFQEMQYKQELLEKEKEELKIKMQEELEANLREREAALLAQLAVQKESVLNEKKQIEESLQIEMAKVLQEKNKELEHQLLDQKEKLEKVLEKKEMEQKLLESQLYETKEESATAKLQALKAREEVLSNFVDLMELELQCSICNELFIKATSLNCAHVFCKLCIGQWMKVKKECPNCRMAITSQMQAIALDSYIDKMVEQLSEELKMRRKELIQQRKDEQDKFDGFTAGPSNSISFGGAPVARGGRGRTRGAGRAPRRGRNRTQAQTAALTTTVAPTPIPPIMAGRAPRRGRNRTLAQTAALTTTVSPTPIPPIMTAAAATVENPIELSDDSESETSNSSDFPYDFVRGVHHDDDIDLEDMEMTDSDSLEGDPRVYYGGYGRCYNCGLRGHWANGCPN
ncbi:unnamed protein product [Lymnaea stagnalis]|uniref:E3 ubiquitin-protein ligase CHFR n=1 Tax=Lymnaea stagnalis TaxID=6523 RepID=A0AAV2H445_LYMST